MAKPRDSDDHITWLLERQRYEEALQAAEANQNLLVVHNVLDIGQKYLTHLVKEKKFEEAAALCPSVLKGDAKLWERWVFIFAEIKRLRVRCFLSPSSFADFPFSNLI